MKTDYKRERVFPLMFIIIGITLIIFGLILLGTFDSRIKLGLTILLIGIVIVFTRKGTIVDFNERKIKNYVGIFFVKIGNWQTIEDYTFISLLSINRTSYGYSRTGVQFSERKKIHRISLLNKTQRSQLLITDFKDKNNAILEAQLLAEKLKVEFVNYSPI
ncbi:hypothetical protein QRD02_10885 [Aequorivita sp. SDUM287046]|uniref:PH domain-containing protein n=1 Tax=Aequorivita aurantiaca TaxID=3053356 RepID=A0ABT8DHK7_9FLAO|nr:hypothetical protein [Aequorivita aurantiaca]MDN3724890.1 hypothetical protein [Aequorivita aurantiaca]